MTHSAHLLSSRAASLLLICAAFAVGSGAAEAATTTTAISGTSATASAITDVRFESTSATVQTNVPVTFGQVFAPGHLSAGNTVSGRLDTGVMIPLQLDVKATHPDGSIRHAIISAVLPSLAAGERRTMSLVQTAATSVTPVTAATLLNAGFTATFSATIDGVRYSASAHDLLKSGKATVWLSGANANEWHVSAPLTSSSGTPHPHLAARFAIRWYDTAKKARVDVAVENNWAYEAGPRNFTYDADFVVGGKSVYSKAGMNHLHHARWRKLAWWGASSPEVNIKHNSAYLIATRAVPNYDQSLVVAESTLAGYKNEWTGAKTEPMGVGMALPAMPTTGGRRDIGLLPAWTASYVLSMDKRARDVTLGTADLSGSWSSHYRDKNTGYPVSVVDYPYMTIQGNATDTLNKATGRYEAFPACAGVDLCKTPNKHDTPHQPNLAYVPYLVTGDYYYLEELHFWGMWSAFSPNPYYREFSKGLVKSDQIRGQAWTLRTLAEAAYITPDKHPLKSHFAGIVDANLNWYNTNYAAGAATSNALGILTNGYAMVYNSGTGVGPWQDDFFTSAVGHAAELGFSKAESLLRFKAKFPIERMVGTGSCWIAGSAYTLKVRDSSTAPLYTTIAKVYQSTDSKFTSTVCGSAEMAASLGLKTGEMMGYSAEVFGYPANMQPALAYAASAGGTQGAAAWSKFMSRTVKPNYALSPQFAIVPRGTDISGTPAPESPPSTTTSTTTSTTVSYTACAVEGEMCSFTGSRTVRYSSASKGYVSKVLTGPVLCSATVFGDPAPGYAKTCSYASTTPTTTANVSAAPTPTTTQPAIETYTACAVEGKTCLFTGTRKVRYSSATKGYTSKVLTGPVLCSAAVFGDPAPGYAKTCSYSSIVQ